MKELMFCKVCNTQTKYTIDNFSRYHLKIHHPEIKNMKHYYDLYFKKEGEGFCQTCGKEVKVDLEHFRFYNGYNKFCSNKCALEQTNSQWDTIAEIRRKNNLEKYGVIHPMKLSENNEKRLKTNIEKYGVEHPAQNEYCKEKSKQTSLEKYGVDNPIKDETIKDKQKKSLVCYFKTDEGKKTIEQINKTKEEFYATNEGIAVNKKRIENLNALYNSDRGIEVKKQMSESRIKMFESSEGEELKKQIRNVWERNGKWIPLSQKSEFELYKMEVNKLTYRKWKKQLYETWDGTDYYTGEKLITNEEYIKITGDHRKQAVNKNPKQPTIDHKISIHYGFTNNISAEQIAHIDNLCICSRYNNVKKGCKIRFIE